MLLFKYMSQLKTFFYSLKQSLFNPSYYKDVAHTKFWFSFKYLWFLLMILVLIKSVSFGASYINNRPYISPGINQIMNRVSNLYPEGLELEIVNGQLSTNIEEPYIFDLEEQQKWNDSRHFLVIDTQGTIDDYPYYNTYILATKNAVVYPSKAENNNIKQSSVFYFRDLKQNFNIDKNVYNNLLDMVRPYTQKAPLFIDWLVTTGLIFFLVFGSFFWSLGIMFGLVFLTVVVWVISKLIGVRYSYGSLYKVGMHAVSWPIIASEITKYLKSPFPNFFSIIFLLWMITVLFALKEPKIEKVKVVKKVTKRRRIKRSK